jgi:hypothetical protein
LYDDDSDARIPDETEIPTAKRRRILLDNPDDMELFDEDLVPMEVDANIPSRAITLKSVVIVAKPAPFYPSVNFGPASSVPNESGIVFPYFYQMITPDYQILNDVVFRHFLENLGDTRENFIKGYKRFESATKTWMDSPEGMVFQHIFFGIDLALQTQARLFVVAEHGQYHGFVLIGRGFSIIAQDMEFQPVDAEQLRIEISSMSPHDLALAEIVKMFSEATIGSTKKRAKVQKADLMSYRSIYTQYHKRTFDSEEKDRIDSLISDLSFPERYWTVNPTNVEKFLSTYVNEEGVYPSPEPMYIGAGLIRETNDHYLALSVFGPTAPSFFTVGGEKKQIPAPGKPDPLSVVDPVTKRPLLPVIPYTMKGIRTAADDLYKVWKDRSIFVLSRERAGPSRTTQFQGSARNQVWDSLKLHIGGRDITDEEKKAKKSAPTADGKDTKGKGKAIGFGFDLGAFD